MARAGTELPKLNRYADYVKGDIVPRLDLSGGGRSLPPSQCAECQQLFEMNRVDQAEARHIAATEGTYAAEAWLDEKYEEEHANH